jgi:hypothetical protein
MLIEEFIHTVKNPQVLNETQINALESIVLQYPFFETAHLLYVKGLQKQNSLSFSKQLRKTAIIANSRIILHELLHKKETVIELVVESKEATDRVIEETKPIHSTITSSDQDIKVIYTTTPIVNYSQKVEETLPDFEINLSESSIPKPIEIGSKTETQVFDIDKLNKTIEQEISRGIIQSYIESDFIKTPELNKIENNEPVSFTDWLHKIQKESHTIQKTEITKSEINQKNTVLTSENEEKPSFFNKNKQLIDKIIESDPGKLKLGNNKFFTPNIDAKQSLLENEHLVTETLAKIYALQGNINKAIRAYEILSLKFPQKSVYFTSLIQNLKNNK